MQGVNSPHVAQRTVAVAHPKLAATYSKAVSSGTSTTLTDLSITLPADTVAIELLLETTETLRIAPLVASVSSGGILTGQPYTLWGTKKDLDLINLYIGTGGTVSVFVYTTEQ